MIVGGHPNGPSCSAQFSLALIHAPWTMTPASDQQVIDNEWCDKNGTMKSISASQARKNLFPLIKQVNDDHAAINISSRVGTAVHVSQVEWNSIQESNWCRSK